MPPFISLLNDSTWFYAAVLMLCWWLFFFYCYEVVVFLLDVVSRARCLRPTLQTLYIKGPLEDNKGYQEPRKDSRLFFFFPRSDS